LNAQMSNTRRYLPAMSQENVDLVLRAIDAFNRRDLTAIGEMSLPDVEVDWSHSAGINAGVYRGTVETLGFWSTFFEVFDRLEVTPLELIEHHDLVVVLEKTRMWGRDGIEVEAHNAAVVSFGDGRIARWAMHRTRDEALKAVGLEE
jgi:ketosteroid isomerase-like protein